MKKSKLFDVIIYRILFSIPVSCVANLVYGLALCISVWISPDLSDALEYIWVTTVTTVPFILFNTTRYLAIKSGYLKYGLIGLFLSSVPEYLFFVLCMLFMYIGY